MNSHKSHNCRCSEEAGARQSRSARKLSNIFNGITTRTERALFVL
jgi:hypothetical protein